MLITSHVLKSNVKTYKYFVPILKFNESVYYLTIYVVNISHFHSCHFSDIKASLSRELPRRLTEV